MKNVALRTKYCLLFTRNTVHFFIKTMRFCESEERLTDIKCAFNCDFCSSSLDV